MGINQQLSTDHVDYLQRNQYSPPRLPAQASMTDAPAGARRLWQVRGVGHYERAQQRAERMTKSERPGKPNAPGVPIPVHLPSEDLLIGLSGLCVPVAFVVHGEPSAVSVYAGAWSQHPRENAPPAVLDSRLQLVGTLLSSLYHSVQLSPAEDVRVPRSQLGGMVLGIPTIKPPESLDGLLPLDRLIRAMLGSRWTVLVLAEPVAPKATNDLRLGLLNEMRSVEAAVEAGRTRSPLAQHYEELLGAALSATASGLAVGAWRTAVYLAGEEDSYYRLASVWQSIYSGDASLPEPVRAWELPEVPAWADAWAMPDAPAPLGPGLFHYPFAYQTLLTSAQLAAYVHLPSVETHGFSVQLVPDYDVVPRESRSEASMSLGHVVDRGRTSESSYDVTPPDLNRHALIAGVTGSGKTNTLFRLVTQLWRQRVPFLVLEPAKTEYRSLLADPQLGPDLRIFTLGAEQVSPLRMNPFEVESGVSVATHIDLLKSVFNASFGMWNPLPQVLEQCLHAVYRDYGWDPVRGTNRRGTASRRGEAFPTLTDLHQKIGEVADSLGYEDRVTSDIKAALMTRVNSLRIGGKGLMLDTQSSIPVEELLRQPTIIELEPVGDDDEKAFLMGLLLIRLYEHLRATGSIEGAGLRHVVVVEEAHRLLANVPPVANQEQSNSRGKAVETFANMLSEVRAYGEGFLVAEQIPSKLALDVIKNTNLKIVHRIVAGDDRQIIGQSMNMDEHQRDMLATLRVGQAAVFAEGEDRPILVAIPYAKIETPVEMRTKGGSDRTVSAHMASFLRRPAFASCYVPFEACPKVCGEPYRYCEEAHELVERREFQDQFSSVVLSLVVPGGSPQQFARPLVEFAAARFPHGTAGSAALACVTLNATRWYVAHYGRRYNWSYDTAGEVHSLLTAALLKVVPPLAVPDARLEDIGPEREALSSAYRAAARRAYNYFPTCPVVCPAPECLFRFHAELLLGDRHLSETFDAGMAKAVRGRWEELMGIDQAIGRLVGFDVPHHVQRSAGLCYGVQQIAFKPGMLDRARQIATERLITGVDARGAASGQERIGKK